jgi:hypothetical protein
MTKTTKKLIGFGLLAASACGVTIAAETTCDAAGLPAVVRMWENETRPINVHPPQRLDVLMSSRPTMAAQIAVCEDMGGELVWLRTAVRDSLGRKGRTHIVCEGVDY